MAFYYQDYINSKSRVMGISIAPDGDTVTVLVKTFDPQTGEANAPDMYCYSKAGLAAQVLNIQALLADIAALPISN